MKEQQACSGDVADIEQLSRPAMQHDGIGRDAGRSAACALGTSRPEAQSLPAAAA